MNGTCSKTMISIFLPVLVWLSCGNDSNSTASSDDFIAIRSGAVTLAGALELPSGDGPHPAIAIVHGSGRASRHTFEGAARLYASLGFATLTYDKRGVGQSSGQYRDVNAGNSIEVFDVLADDAVAVVEFLKTHPKVRTDKIGLLGPSQAGWIIPLAASRSSDIAFIVCVSGAASTVGVSDFYDQIAEQNLSDEQIAEALSNFSGTHGFDPVPSGVTYHSWLVGLWRGR